MCGLLDYPKVRMIVLYHRIYRHIARALVLPYRRVIGLPSGSIQAKLEFIGTMPVSEIMGVDGMWLRQILSQFPTILNQSNQLRAIGSLLAISLIDQIPIGSAMNPILVKLLWAGKQSIDPRIDYRD
jgi:hypothetical protein